MSIDMKSVITRRLIADFLTWESEELNFIPEEGKVEQLTFDGEVKVYGEEDFEPVYEDGLIKQNEGPNVKETLALA